jgi:hypothetical protein
VGLQPIPKAGHTTWPFQYLIGLKVAIPDPGFEFGLNGDNSASVLPTIGVEAGFNFALDRLRRVFRTRTFSIKHNESVFPLQETPQEDIRTSANPVVTIRVGVSIKINWADSEFVCSSK